MTVNSSLTGTPLKAVERTKVSDQISGQLLERIVGGEYPAGAQLPSERDIAEMTNVSRVAVREAIGSLVAKGVVSVKQGRGTIVNPVDEWNMLDAHLLLLVHGDKAIRHLMEFRMMLEPEMAAMAAERITPEEVETLSRLSALPEDDTAEQHAERDTTFHLYIAKVSGNPVLLMVMTSVQELMDVNRRKAFIVPGALAQARHWHQEIFRAMAARAPQAARQAMIHHIQQVIDALKIDVYLNYK